MFFLLFAWLLHYEGWSKSFAIQYDAQTTQAKQLHYFSI